LAPLVGLVVGACWRADCEERRTCGDLDGSDGSDASLSDVRADLDGGVVEFCPTSVACRDGATCAVPPDTPAPWLTAKSADAIAVEDGGVFLFEASTDPPNASAFYALIVPPRTARSFELVADIAVTSSLPVPVHVASMAPGGTPATPGALSLNYENGNIFECCPTSASERICSEPIPLRDVPARVRWVVTPTSSTISVGCAAAIVRAGVHPRCADADAGPSFWLGLRDLSRPPGEPLPSTVRLSIARPHLSLQP